MSLKRVLLIAICCVSTTFLLAIALHYAGVKNQQPERAVHIQTQALIALVVPHHDLLSNKFQSFYEVIPAVERSAVRQIVLLAPNHFQPESTVMKTTDRPFVVSGGEKIDINATFLPVLLEKEVKIDREVFADEHAVFLHLPLIAKNYPDATITPLLLTRNVPKKSLDTVIAVLRESVGTTDTLLLVSTDFSHYLPFAQAEKNDARILSLINAKDADTILRLNDDYVDCPACMYMLLQLLPKTAGQANVVFHGNAAQYMSLAADEPTTSYYVLKW